MSDKQTKIGLASIGDIFSVLAENSTEIVEIVNRIGLANLIKSGPAIYRIMKTIADRKQDFEEVEKILYYSDATKAKVVAFQKRYDLQADGLVGDETWGKVEKLLKLK